MSDSPIESDNYDEVVEETDYNETVEMEEDDINFEDLKQDLQRFQKEDIVRDALEKEVDLRAYGERINNELHEASLQSVDDYLHESVYLAHLHNEIKVSDTILSQMQELLHKFQKDLSAVSSEIRVLQNESLNITVKLNNRKAADVFLRDFINKIALTPTMVKILSDGAINKQYMDTLDAFIKQLDYIYNPQVDPSTGVAVSDIPAIQESREDIDILKNQTGIRIKNYLFDLLKDIKKETNIQIYQKEVLLQYNILFSYLIKYVPKTAEDMKSKYISTMKEICTSTFKEYKEGLMSHCKEIGTADDILIHTDNVVMSFLKKTSQQNKKVYTWTTHELNNRHLLINNVYTQPLLLHVLESEHTTLTYPEVYRSLLKQYIDMIISEYQFTMQFFSINNNSIANDIYAAINKILIDSVNDYLKGCYDVIGIAICAIITNIYKQKLEEEKVFILSDILTVLRNKFQDKYSDLMDKNIKSVHDAQSRVKNIQVDEPIHYYIKRYANLSTALLVMNANYSQFIDQDIFVNRLNVLTKECLDLLTKIGNRQDSSNSFIIKNCNYIINIYENYHIPQEPSVQKLFDENSHTYIQEKLEKYFKFLINFVNANKENVGGNLKISSKDSTNIKRYTNEWKKAVEDVYKIVFKDFGKEGLNIYKMVITELTNYNAKYIQILQGTASAKDVVPLQTIINELAKYRSNYD